MTRPFVSLDVIEIASPCQASWETMIGDDRSRFCEDCKLNVYNLSDMSRGEAEALVNAREGRLCVRFFRRADGTVLTRDCPVGLRAIRRRVARVLTGIAALIAFLCAGIVAGGAGSNRNRPATTSRGPLVKIAEWLDPPAVAGGLTMGGCAPPSPMPTAVAPAKVAESQDSAY